MNEDAPLGFRFAGIHTGVKRDPNKRDLALIAVDRDAAAAGVFTTNRVCAAPVQVSRARVPRENARGVVVNSGNANACTGEAGRQDALAMSARLAERLSCAPEQVLVCSTGIIGRPLPMDKIVPGIDAASKELAAGAAAAARAAEGILTTDTVAKIASRQVQLPGGTARLFGVSKGAAMIGPNMATMLGFLFTDALASCALLDRVLREAVHGSFNSISVEGHTSTNDTVLLLASGASGAVADGAGEEDFAQAVHDLCAELARKIIEDAEGATHLVVIDVQGTRSDEEARRIAKAVADSPLVKTAIYGNDPNWGRICSAAGYAGVEFEERNLSLKVNGVLLYDRGAPTRFDPAAESARMKASRETHLEITLDLGPGRCRFWTSDLTVEYVRFNADYTT